VIAQTPGVGVCHRGHELCLGAGDATIVQADAPGKCRSHTGVAVVELSMPQSEWSTRGVPSGDHLMRHLRRERDGLKLLSGYLRSIRTLGISVSPEGRELVRRHVIDLAIMAAVHQEPIGESQESAVVAARRAAALRHIARHFQDPGLSISTTAAALRISPRYLQKLLATIGTSFTDYVTEMRLQLAIQLLAESRQRIADIALQAGFCDVSNFNRIFKARFGDTPRAMRGHAPQNMKSAN
jgi:AraC-like DNA-binding protein